MRYFIFIITLSIYANTQAQSVPTLAQIQIKLDAQQSLPLSNKISFELSVAKPIQVAEVLTGWDNISVKQIGDSTLLVSIIGESDFSGKVFEKHLAESFVIDLAEDSMKQFITGYATDVEQQLALKDIEKYVHAYIKEPTYINGFNIASVVARQRSGDCTEYAVLTTAFARSLGLPSRVVLGTVMAETKDQVFAFGHAWSEVWFDDRWQVVDAALYESKEIQRFYLPAGELKNEGPGFGMSLFSVIGRLPKEISHLQSL